MFDDKFNKIYIKVKINGKETEIDLSGDLEINLGDINESFIDQAAKYAWYGTLCNNARLELERIKNELAAKIEYKDKSLYALLDKRSREEISAIGEKITEGKVESWIYDSQEYQAIMHSINSLRENTITAEYSYNMLYTAVQAFNQRRDMLISLGANIRAEWGSIDLKIKNQDEDLNGEVFERAKAITAERKAIKNLNNN